MIQTSESEHVRTRVLDAAETLFGATGLQASIREITVAAKANLAAINYYFKSKEGLIAAVLARRAEPINAERLRLLNDLEALAQGNPVPLEDVLRAFLMPTRSLMSGNSQFLRFAGRVILDPSESMRQVVVTQFGGVAQRFHQALCRSLHPLSPQEVWVRLSFLVGSVLYLWTNGPDMVGRFAGPGMKAPTDDEMIERLVQYGAAGMRGALREGAPL
jgi:AcrR family transcriptional regulator